MINGIFDQFRSEGRIACQGGAGTLEGLHMWLRKGYILEQKFVSETFRKLWLRKSTLQTILLVSKANQD